MSSFAKAMADDKWSRRMRDFLSVLVMPPQRCTIAATLPGPKFPTYGEQKDHKVFKTAPFI